METIDASVIETYSNNPSVKGVLAVTASNPFTPLADGFDLLLLVVADDEENRYPTTHYIKDRTSIQERRVSAKGLEQWILSGDNRNIIQWVLQGQICFDREGYLQSVRDRLIAFPDELREQKLLMEFTCFLRTYLQAKTYMKEGHILDAYSNILEALVHWARIAIIENGQHPEVMVWQQLRKINPGIYKLFEELTESVETVKQRVELVLLACEFHLISKMPDCCKLLLGILGSRKEPFSPAELQQHDKIKPLHLDLAIVLKKMARRGLIKEVHVLREGSDPIGALEVLYTVSKPASSPAAKRP